jgi:hypothetical protein
MKTKKIRSVVLSIIMTSTLTIGSEAHAYDFAGAAKKLFQSAKEMVVEAQRKAQAFAEEKKEQERKEEERQAQEAALQSVIDKNTNVEEKAEAAPLLTSDSLLKLTGEAPEGAKWIMYATEKDGEKTVAEVSAITDRNYDNTLSLRMGAGTYKINIFYSKAESSFENQYKFLSTVTVENNDKRDMKYLLPSLLVQSQDERIVNQSKELTANATTDEEIVRAIFEHVITTIKYNTAGYEDGSARLSAYDAITTMEKSQALCAGYANYFAALLRAAGIKTKIINGSGLGKNGYEDHAWNEVYVNGDWKIIDTTWSVDRTDDKFYFADPVEFAKDHKKTLETDF